MQKRQGAQTTKAKTNAAFITLASYRDGGIISGRFRGDSSLEKHANGDEIVQTLTGAATLTILTNKGEEFLNLSAGMLVVVPQDHWNRFNAPEIVTVMTATPQPTKHTLADDPRKIPKWK